MYIYIYIYTHTHTYLCICCNIAHCAWRPSAQPAGRPDSGQNVATHMYNICIYMYIHVCIYIYTYMYRERDIDIIQICVYYMYMYQCYMIHVHITLIHIYIYIYMYTRRPDGRQNVGNLWPFCHMREFKGAVFEDVVSDDSSLVTAYYDKICHDYHY